MEGSGYDATRLLPLKLFKQQIGFELNCNCIYKLSRWLSLLSWKASCLISRKLNNDRFLSQNIKLVMYFLLQQGISKYIHDQIIGGCSGVPSCLMYAFYRRPFSCLQHLLVSIWLDHLALRWLNLLRPFIWGKLWQKKGREKSHKVFRPKFYLGQQQRRWMLNKEKGAFSCNDPFLRRLPDPISSLPPDLRSLQESMSSPISRWGDFKVPCSQ